MSSNISGILILRWVIHFRKIPILQYSKLKISESDLKMISARRLLRMHLFLDSLPLFAFMLGVHLTHLLVTRLLEESVLALHGIQGVDWGPGHSNCLELLGCPQVHLGLLWINYAYFLQCCCIWQLYLWVQLLTLVKYVNQEAVVFFNRPFLQKLGWMWG